MLLYAETDARSLVSAVVLIVLIGLLGMVLVVGLMVAWRRSLERRRTRITPAADTPDAWQEAARRLTETDGDAARSDDADRDPPEDPFDRNH